MQTHTHTLSCFFKSCRSHTCPVFIHYNEKQGEESRGEECAAARITALTPTQTQCLTNTGNNESNNINTLWQTTTSDLPAPPFCSSYSVIQNTQDFRKLLRKLEFQVRRCWAVWTGRNLVDKSHYTFYTQKLFSGSQKCQDSVTGSLNNFIRFGLFCLGSAGFNLAKTSISISRCQSVSKIKSISNIQHTRILSKSSFLQRKR